MAAFSEARLVEVTDVLDDDELDNPAQNSATNQVRPQSTIQQASQPSSLLDQTSTKPSEGLDINLPASKNTRVQIYTPPHPSQLKTRSSPRNKSTILVPPPQPDPEVNLRRPLNLPPQNRPQLQAPNIMNFHRQQTQTLDLSAPSRFASPPVFHAFTPVPDLSNQMMQNQNWQHQHLSHPIPSTASNLPSMPVPTRALARPQSVLLQSGARTRVPINTAASQTRQYNPPLAHSSAISPGIIQALGPQYLNNVAMIRNNFRPQAAPVRTAFDDYIRQLNMAIPGFDISMFLKDMNNGQHIHNQTGNGVNMALQNQLKQTIEASMLQALGNPHSSSQPLGSNIMDDIIADQRKTLQQVQRRPPPPSEDEMARQDADADANHDEEFHEIETYADYTPAKLSIGKPHPDPIVETSSLSTVEPPDVEYQLKLPSKVIDNGLLSALQLESVIYACQQHSKFLADYKTRKGFLIGDGAGVGKGRTIAGIIFENHLCGRKKSIWLSVSTDLKLDAERDLSDIGAKHIPVNLLGKFTYGKKINVDTGVIFTTYSGLVSKSQTVRGALGNRLGQLTSWAGSDFDGVIVFDECHKAKNISMGKKKQHSKAAEFAVELQKRLPNARVVYASATGASETKHLGYMGRLGIWGPGTPFETFQDFCGSIEKRGVGAMELVAVDLKMRGSYIARQLSFKTTSFEIRIAKLDEAFISLYNQCAELWYKALKYFTEATTYFAHDKKFSKSVWACFWGAHQKFFKYLCIGAKVPVVVEIAKEALANGKCVVIGLQSTGEAKTLEALEDGDINEFVSTAKATFESLIEQHFPAPQKPSPSRYESDISAVQAMDSPLNSSSEGKLPSTSGSSTVDESWHNHKDIKFMVGDGHVKAKLDESKSNSKRRRSGPDESNYSRNKKALHELAKEKREQRKLVTGRSLRAKRRCQKRGQANSRIKLADDDSDTDFSNPLSLSSVEGQPSSSTSSRKRESSDETYDEDDSDESDDEEEYSSTLADSDSDDSAKAKRQCPTETKKTSKNPLNSDSDSDIVITAVRPKKNYEVIILSSDDDGEEEDLDDNDPLKVHGPRLTAMKDELLYMIQHLGPKLPNNTLDDLIDRLGGPDKVAEMTGRKGRVVKDEDGQISYRQRNETDALENLNVAEKERFMKGTKLVAIISEAASSGISLQADKRVANTRRRVHVTIELPWSADRAIQQFGRTHRSNQVSGPEYVFVISELSGEKRFASIVAKRLESLGALTHGDRRATTESRDLSQFNIASRYCKQALELLCRYLELGTRFADIEPDYNRDNFRSDAQEAFCGTGLGRMSRSIFCPDPAALQINHFLNRLLGMKVEIQNAIFKLFTDYMDRLILRKKVTGNYDAGILELNSASGATRCAEPENFYLSTKSGKVKCTLRHVQVERGISWESAVDKFENKTKPDSRNGFYMSTNPLTKAKMIFLVLREDLDLFRAYKPNTGRQTKAQSFTLLTEKAEKCTTFMAEKIWRHVYEETDTKCIHLCFFKSCKRLDANLKCDIGMRHRNYYILSGGILTAWPYLEEKAPGVTQKLQIVRLKLDSKNRVIGPIIPQDSVDHVRKILRKGEEGIEF